MKWHSLAWAALAGLVLFGSLAGPPLRADTFTLRGFDFTVPEGYVVELAAEPPMVAYPTFADFDDSGRLYVSEVSGVENWQDAQPADDEDKLHRVLRLEDTDGDGKFDRRTVFARFDHPPQGSQWLDGSLYVASPPIIWKLTDTDDDGVADRREKWVEQHELTGCLNDLHGPNLGPDGYLYWTKGAGAVQNYMLEGKPWSTTARHILRRHPDGVDTEQLMVGGMDNPVEITFSPDGERFVTCTNMHLNGNPRKDGIIHAAYGGVYPKDMAPVYEFPWTAPTFMPEMAGWEALSPAGILRYQGMTPDDAFADNLFTAVFSGHRIIRSVLEPNGATYRSQESDFLSCEDVQFHPTDVLEDADGSFLVLDTGGWYKHCCPSSTFYRPDVRGAIYRVRRADAAKVDDPRGLKIAWADAPVEQIASLLADTRPAVRGRATNELGRRGPAAVTALQQVLDTSDNATARTAAIWAASRIDDPAARAAIRSALDDDAEQVRHTALTAISLHRDAAAREALQQIVADEQASPTLRRVAAEGLGRIRDAAAVPTLLAALATPRDRYLEHALTYALIEIADPPATAAGLTSDHPYTVRAAMIALDQMPGGSFDPKLVASALNSPDPAMRDAAWWLISRHPDRSAALLTDVLQQGLSSGALSDSERRALVTRLGGIARSPQIAEWLAKQLNDPSVSPTAQRVYLDAMAEAGGTSAEIAWLEAIDHLLASTSDVELIGACIATLDRFPSLKSDYETQVAPLVERLRALAARADLADDVRVRALTAIPVKQIGTLDDAPFLFLVDQLGIDVPLDVRARSADVLTRAKLTKPQLLKLSELSGSLATTELERMLDIFRTENDEEVGMSLVASLEKSTGLAGLHPSRLQSSLAGYSPEVQERAKPLFDRLAEAYREQLTRAETVRGLVEHADAQHGLQVFSSKKAACTSCHQAAHVGGTIGPHLRGVGKRRTERDLIESIIFPSASFVQSYEPWTIQTVEGQVFTGVVQKDMPDELVLSGGPEKTFHIRRDEIDVMERATVSIMPAGLEKNLSDQDLADLVAFLMSLK